MAEKILGISWLNHRFHAVVTQSRAVLATWSGTGPVTRLEEFEASLSQAVAATGFSGRRVALTLDNRNVVHHLQELPPGKPATVRRLLDRLIQQQNFFHEPALWQSQDLPGTSDKNRVLLTLIPRSLAEGLSSICSRAGLQLKSLFAPATILQHLMANDSRPDPGAGMIALDAGGLLCLVATTHSGQMLFSRSVVLSEEGDTSRIPQEVNRTMLFTRQQFGLSVTECRCVGSRLESQLKTSPVAERIDIRLLPVDADEWFLAGEAARLPAGHEANLAVTEQAESRWTKPGMAIAAGILLAASLALTGFVEFGLRIHAREQAKQEQDNRALDSHSSQAQAQQLEIERLKRELEALRPESRPPLPTMLLKHLAGKLPDNLILTSLALSESADGWDLRINGVSGVSLVETVPSLEILETALTDSPFELRITNSTLQQLFQQETSNSQRSRHAQPAPGLEGFYITGRIR